MFKALATRLRQGYRTIGYPTVAPVLPDRFSGRPELTGACASADCEACAAVCPTDAIAPQGGRPRLDLGRCLFCGECAAACPGKLIRFTRDHRMAVRNRDDFEIGASEYKLAQAVDHEARRLFGRSLKLRQVSAGGCGACEADINVLGTVVFDVGRFGIQVVASPRHADGLLITGPVPENMREALVKTWAAVPAPRLVIAVGSCAISGGVFAGRPEVNDGAGGLLRVDLFIPGCPPHPVTILDGLLRLLGRLEGSTIE